MIWLGVLVLAALVVAPLATPLWRRTPLQGRQATALVLHRAQLAELDRDLAERRIAPADHATAVLEVQRRLLLAAGQADAAPRAGSPVPLAVAAALVPVAALALYLVNGQPGLPAAPLAERMAAADRRRAESEVMVRQIREVLARQDPRSDQARQGFVLLGNVLEAEGDGRAAAAAWRQALSVRFDALLAARAADASSRAEGRLDDADAALFRRALAAAPPDAPWRTEVEQRLAERVP